MFLVMFDVMRNYDKLSHTMFDVMRSSHEICCFNIS